MSRRESAHRSGIQELLTGLARGDRAAFDPLFAQLWPVVRGFAARCLPASEADDAAQDAMLRIFFRASEFDPSRDALAWVLGVAAWQIRTQRAKARRRRETDPSVISDRPDPGRSPEQGAIARDLSSALERALAELPPADAATLLAYARGDSPGVPGPTFRKRVQRAVARLRARWRYDHGHF